jgi:MscS family membrane protein
MTTISDILNSEILGVSVERLGLFFIIIFLTFVAKSFFLFIIDKKITVLIKKTQTEFDDLIISSIRNPLSYLILLQGFYLAIISLRLPEKIGLVNIASIVHNAYVLAISFILLYFVFKIIDVIGFYIYKMVERSETRLDDQLAPLLVKSLRIFIVTLGILFILNNFGYNIASLLAGLGIGGLAFALAAQDTVSNLFGSFTSTMSHKT